MVPLRSQRLAAKRNSPLRPAIDRQRENGKTFRHSNRRQKCSPRKTDKKQIGSPSEAPYNNTVSRKDDKSPNVSREGVPTKLDKNGDDGALDSNGNRTGISGDEQGIISNHSVDAARGSTLRKGLSTSSAKKRSSRINLEKYVRNEGCGRGP